MADELTDDMRRGLRALYDRISTCGQFQFPAVMHIGGAALNAELRTAEYDPDAWYVVTSESIELLDQEVLHG